MRKILRSAMQHFKCRNNFYPRTDNSVQRCPVPDENISWDIPFPNYCPPAFTAEYVLKGPVWADKEINLSSTISWNSLDGNVDRRSHMGDYKLDPEGRPLNPVGRTGLRGRGCLGRWGPNHAADPIVTRWKTEAGSTERKVMSDDGHPILQFVAILRGDCQEWALPGGMVDPGEKVSKTLQREFFEEAMDSSSGVEKQKIQSFFETGGQEIYSGYVDDPRNTDNSWMETVAVNYHDLDGSVFGDICLKAGDDAVGVQWKDLSRNLQLYASHLEFLKKVAEKHNAHW